LLTEAVRQKPYSVILLDECEKAHIDVLNIFYQVFDKGVLTDAEGKTVNFANTIILLASNLASTIIESVSNSTPRDDLASVIEAIRPTLANHFQPALLARMTIVPYRTLDHEALRRIAALKLAGLARLIATNNGAELVYGEEVVSFIADRCLDNQTGARDIDRLLSAQVMPQMAQEILSRMSQSLPEPKTINLGLDESQGFKIEFDRDLADPS
jgi:type VI secretion system protein VasG